MHKFISFSLDFIQQLVKKSVSFFQEIDYFIYLDSFEKNIEVCVQF